MQSIAPHSKAPVNNRDCGRTAREALMKPPVAIPAKVGTQYFYYNCRIPAPVLIMPGQPPPE